MTGEQWLAQVVQPILDGLRRMDERRKADPDFRKAIALTGARLAAQVEALADTGVLTEAEEAQTLASLQDAGLISERLARTSSTWSSSTFTVRAAPALGHEAMLSVPVEAPVGPPELVAVSPGPIGLGDLDGFPLTLVVLELWTDGLAVDMYAPTSREHRSAWQRSEREQHELARRRRRGEEVPETPYRSPPSPLANLHWSLRDEVNTEYYRGGNSGHTDFGLDRIRIEWHPCPPPTVRQVRLRAAGDDDAEVVAATMRLPGR